MERETKTIVTPGQKHTVILNAYITGRESNQLRDIWRIEGKTDNEKYDLTQETALKMIIRSIDGHKDGEEVDGKTFSVSAALLDMRKCDTKFVVRAIDDITADKEFDNPEKPEDGKKVS